MLHHHSPASIMKFHSLFVVCCLLCELFSMLDFGWRWITNQVVLGFWFICAFNSTFFLIRSVELFIEFSFFSFPLLSLVIEYGRVCDSSVIRCLFCIFCYKTSTRYGWMLKSRRARWRGEGSKLYLFYLSSCFFLASRCNLKLNQTRWPDSTCCFHHHRSSLTLHLKLSHSTWLHFLELIYSNNNHLPH